MRLDCFLHVLECFVKDSAFGGEISVDLERIEADSRDLVGPAIA